MTTIPETIMEEARELYGDPASYPSIEQVALAIVAAEKRGADRERERAAKIAEGGMQGDGTFIYTVEGEAIATAIRSTSEE